MAENELPARPVQLNERDAINVRGVIAIRWVAVLGQFLTIMVVHLALGVALPLVPLLIILAITAAINLPLVLLYRAKPPGSSAIAPVKWQPVLGLTMLFDLVALTLLLYFTGGMANPFSLFYFVNLVLSAMLLPKSWAWGLTAFATGCVAYLFVNFRPIPILQVDSPWEAGPGSSVDVATLGGLVAFATCATVIVFFTSYISGKLRLHEERFRELADLRARSERIRSLGTLAAGAAHELGSPLSTIAIISEEVERELRSGQLTDQTLQGVQTIRSELGRCRNILDRMSTEAGSAIGESMTKTTVGALVHATVEGLGPSSRVETTFAEAAETAELLAPIHGLSQALRSILQNAIDAAQGEMLIRCHAEVADGYYRVTVQDRGPGMDAETLRHAGEPFFTTKEPGKGTGLGLFLARNVIEGLGGNLTITSTRGEGTSVIAQLPLNPSRKEGWEPAPYRGELFTAFVKNRRSGGAADT